MEHAEVGMETDSVAAKVGPVDLRVTGRELTQFVIMLLGFGVIVWMIHEHDAAQSVAHQEMLIVSQEQTFFLSLSPEEREQYKLKMPPSLRDKLVR